MGTGIAKGHTKTAPAGTWSDVVGCAAPSEYGNWDMR